MIWHKFIKFFFGSSSCEVQQKLMGLYSKVCLQPPLNGLDTCRRGKRYLEKNCKVVLGPTVDYERECLSGIGTASWLCKTNKENWFLIHKLFALGVANGIDGGILIEPISAEEASHLQIHRHSSLRDQHYGELEEA